MVGDLRLASARRPGYQQPRHCGAVRQSRSSTRRSVRRYFADGIALGKIFIPKFGPPGRQPAPITIVGVVGDAVFMSLRHQVPPTIYEPLAQWPSGNPPGEISISVRSVAGSPAKSSPAVAAALTAVNRDVAFSFRPLADQVNASLVQERLVAMLSGFFGALALLLAGLGLYGLTSSAVTRRQNGRSAIPVGARRPVGRRDGAGASPEPDHNRDRNVGGVGRRGGTHPLSRRDVVRQVTPLDPVTFAAVALLFAAVATLAAWIPARRAAGLDPSIALRCE